MHASTTQSKWAVNDLCKVIVGFRNFTTHATRSKYVSFAVVEQPQMCDLLIKLSQGRIGQAQVAQYPTHLFEQLIDYGFLRPVHKLGLGGQLKRVFNVLNSGRLRSIPYRGRYYYVSSFVFMAFYSQQEDDFLRESIVLPAWSPALAAAAYEIIVDGFDAQAFEALPGSLKKRLHKHGLVTPPGRLPYRERFFGEQCQLSTRLIDELPAFYRQHLPKADASQGHYVVNSGIYHSIDDADAALRAQIPNLAWAVSCTPSVWVRDPVKGIVSMYWLTPAQQQKLDGLIAGQLRADDLDRETFELFVYSGMLYDDRQIAAQRQAWRQRLEALGGQLAQQGCMTFESILSPIELSIGRKYLRFMMDKKFLLLDKANGNIQQRFWCHRDEFTFYLQGQVCALLNQVLPERVKPGHNALTIYETGATLPRHQDDVLAFSWVMSLPLEAQPEANKEQAWPIYVETPSTVHKAMLQSGDGHLINPQMPHWRDMLEDGRLSILFLWFVPHDFRGFVNGSWVE